MTRWVDADGHYVRPSIYWYWADREDKEGERTQTGCRSRLIVNSSEIAFETQGDGEEK